MSDVTLKCAHCGRQVVVSEFVDPESLKCPGCGEKLPFARRRDTRSTPTLVSKRHYAEQDATQDEQADVAVRRRRRKRRGRAPAIFRIAQFQFSEYALSWVVFLVLTPILVRLRFGGVLTGESLDACKSFGMIGLGVIYLIVLLDAFRDEMFQGLLCLFIPPYTVYYLFFMSDSFSLRALLGAFVLSFGYDTYMWSSAYAKIFIDAGLNWVSQGGDYNPK